MKIRILKERKLTDAEKSKREKIAKAIEKESPKMPMDKKMAIATAQAKKNEEQLEEISAMGGSVSGHAGVPLATTAVNKKFNEKEKKKSKLKDKKMEEMYSHATPRRSLRFSIKSAEKEHSGHVEKSQHQGLRNVMEDDDNTQAMQGGSDNFGMAKQGTVWKLSDFANTSKNASRVFDVLKDAEENIGLNKMRQAILQDKSAKNRADIMSSKFGYGLNLLEKIQQADQEAIKKYYQFLINEFLFWIAYNPMSSAQQYSGKRSLLSKPTKDLAYAHIHRYVRDPNRNNPKSLGQRVSKQGDFYKLTKDLDPALYELPEE